jgi:hypothetical protein
LDAAVCLLSTKPLTNGLSLEPADPHFDMLSALHKMISVSPLTWTTRQRHIKGHQEKNDATAELDFWLGSSKYRTFKWITWLRFSGCNIHIQLPSCIPSPMKIFKFGLVIGSSPLADHLIFDHIHDKTALVVA